MLLDNVTDSCNKLVADTAVVINNVGLLMLLDNVTDSCNNLVVDTAVVTNKVGLQAT